MRKVRSDHGAPGDHRNILLLVDRGLRVHSFSGPDVFQLDVLCGLHQVLR